MCLFFRLITAQAHTLSLLHGLIINSQLHSWLFNEPSKSRSLNLVRVQFSLATVSSKLQLYSALAPPHNTFVLRHTTNVRRSVNYNKFKLTRGGSRLQQVWCRIVAGPWRSIDRYTHPSLLLHRARMQLYFIFFLSWVQLLVHPESVLTGEERIAVQPEYHHRRGWPGRGPGYLSSACSRDHPATQPAFVANCVSAAPSAACSVHFGARQPNGYSSSVNVFMQQQHTCFCSELCFSTNTADRSRIIGEICIWNKGKPYIYKAEAMVEQASKGQSTLHFHRQEVFSVNNPQCKYGLQEWTTETKCKFFNENTIHLYLNANNYWVLISKGETIKRNPISK